MKNTSGHMSLNEKILHLSRDKSNKSLLLLLVQGFLAGIYVSIGTLAYLKVAASTADPGIGAFFGALVFPFGVIAVLIMGAELFTSDCMVMTAVYNRRTKTHKIFKILLIIFIANVIGCIFIAYLTNSAGIFDNGVMEFTADIAIKKVNMPFYMLLVSGILCNIIISTGVCLSYSSKSEMASIAVIWLSMAVFVISGTDNVVANAYYLFTAYFAGADITLIDIIYNLLVSSLGNFIGGGIIVSGANRCQQIGVSR